MRLLGWMPMRRLNVGDASTKPENVPGRKTACGERSLSCRPSRCIGLNDLPAELRESATLLAFIVSRIDGGGPLHRLAFDDVPDPDGLIAKALVDAGLIALCEPTHYLPRWQCPDVEDVGVTKLHFDPTRHLLQANMFRASPAVSAPKVLARQILRDAVCGRSTLLQRRAR
jgi:hypothetical protein